MIDDKYYVLVNRYQEASVSDRLSSFLKICDRDACKITVPLDRLYSMQTRTTFFEIIPMSRIRHKCISVAVKNFHCLSEIRNDSEHD